MVSVTVVIPQYGKFEYTANALKSLCVPASLRDNSQVRVVLVDDASPNFYESLPDIMEHVGSEISVDWVRFEQNQGLTAAWNLGMVSATQTVLSDYAVCANNDIKVIPGWLDGIVDALEVGDLVGPLTNAPGSERRQDVTRQTGLNVADNENDFEAVAAAIRKQPAFIPSSINGFFLAAKTSSWLSGRYDAVNSFKPLNLYNSKGQKNPTPRMTLNEYELQGRWKAQGRRVGIAPRSFVFHYRAVTRGLKVPGSHKGATRLADHNTLRPK